MWIMMIISYMTVSFFDLKATKDKITAGKLMLYIFLMAVSCAIGIANGYVLDMPSPAEPLRRMVLSIIGK